MTCSYRYTLQDFTNIIFDGFEIKLPDETLSIITDLALQVGSPTYIKTPTFQKREIRTTTAESYTSIENNNGFGKKKRRGNRSSEALIDEDWNSVRAFQPTKIEQNVGLDAQIDSIRLCLNKMTDKNYNDQSVVIIEILGDVVDENCKEDIMRVGKAIFEIASNNRFFSKLYADLYSQLIQRYEIMREIFDINLNTFLELFKIIEHADADKDYDKFCKVNLDNERRKSLGAFFVNLVANKIITENKLVELGIDLLKQIIGLMKEENKKNEIDEMIENISILYNKKLFDSCTEKIGDNTFIETIEMLARCKVKMYPSLSSKSIFKCMDMVDM